MTVDLYSGNMQVGKISHRNQVVYNYGFNLYFQEIVKFLPLKYTTFTEL